MTTAALLHTRKGISFLVKTAREFVPRRCATGAKLEEEPKENFRVI
jgi:hypothetical protein